MLKVLASRIMFVGKTTTFCVGLAVILAVAIGVGTTALAAVPGDPFRLGKSNVVSSVTTLASSASKGTLKVVNSGYGPALNLAVGQGDSPVSVNPESGTATNLSADRLDGKDSSDFYTSGSRVADSETLDGLDSSDFLGEFGARVTDRTAHNSSDEKEAFVRCPDGQKPIQSYVGIHSRPAFYAPGTPSSDQEIAPVAITNQGSLLDHTYSVSAFEFEPYEDNWHISLIVRCAKIYPADGETR